MDFPVPALPETNTLCPLMKPPCKIPSNPGTPVFIRFCIVYAPETVIPLVGDAFNLT